MRYDNVLGHIAHILKFNRQLIQSFLLIQSDFVEHMSHSTVCVCGGCQGYDYPCMHEHAYMSMGMLHRVVMIGCDSKMERVGEEVSVR